VNDADVTKLVHDVVRGDRNATDLNKAGIRISRYDDVIEIDNPQRIFVKVSSKDIACGLLKFQSSLSELKKWAGLILASSSFIDLEELDNDPNGDALISALWDTTFEDHCSESTFLLAREIVSAAEES
jgi:hypothetical protein